MLCLSPTYSGGFVSGGADGNVGVWDNQLNVKGSIITIRQVHFSLATYWNWRCLVSGSSGCVVVFVVVVSVVAAGVDVL